MTDVARMGRLAQLTAVRLQAAQTEMAKLNRQEAALRNNLAQLVADRTAASDQALARGGATPLAGTDIRWHAWVDERRATINAELAHILALKEACATRLKRAFGRDQAAQMLQRQAAQNTLRVARRRADYES